MSWSISATGTPDGVLKAVNEQAESAKKYGTEGNKFQAEAARVFISAEVEALRAGMDAPYNGVEVSASGHAGGPTDYRNVNISIKKVRLTL